MNRWITKKIADIADVVAGGTPSTNNSEFWNGDICWITPADLSGYKYRYIANGARNISSAGLNNSSAYLLPKNTVLLSSRAPIGYVAIAEKELATNQGFKNLICDDTQVDYRFMYYWLQLNADALKSFASGATFPELSAGTVKKIKVTLPDIVTQNRIADILFAYDELIEANTRRIELLEQTAQELYKEWVVRFRFPGHEKTKFENGLPEGWQIKRIGDLFDITSSKRVYLADYVDDGIPFYRSKEIIQLSQGQAITEPLYISNEAFRNFKNKFGAPEKNDILITSVGTIGVSYLVDGHEFYFKDGNLTWIKSSFDKMLSLYLFQWLNSQGGKQQLLQSTIGTSQSALTIENLKKIKLLVPTKVIVENYYNKTHAMLEQKRALQLNNQNLAAQRDMLLPRLMSGKLEV